MQIPEIMNSNLILTNLKTAYDRQLAEFVMTSCLYHAKKLPRLISNKASRDWDYFKMDMLYGKTMVILGYGSIGRDTARAAKLGFGMNVIGVKRRPGDLADEFAD